MVLLSTQQEVQSCQERAVERQMDRESLSTAHLDMRTAALPKRSSHPLFVRAVCIIEKCTPANRQISTSFSNAGRDSFTWRCVESHNNQNDLNTPSLFDEAHRGSRKSSQESSGCSPLCSERSLCAVPIFRLMKGHGRRRARMRGRSLLPSRRL